jgi:hypothetical protein
MEKWQQAKPGGPPWRFGVSTGTIHSLPASSACASGLQVGPLAKRKLGPSTQLIVGKMLELIPALFLLRTPKHNCTLVVP